MDDKNDKDKGIESIVRKMVEIYAMRKSIGELYAYYTDLRSYYLMVIDFPQQDPVNSM